MFLFANTLNQTNTNRKNILVDIIIYPCCNFSFQKNKSLNGYK